MATFGAEHFTLPVRFEATQTPISPARPARAAPPAAKKARVAEDSSDDDDSTGEDGEAKPPTAPSKADEDDDEDETDVNEEEDNRPVAALKKAKKEEPNKPPAPKAKPAAAGKRGGRNGALDDLPRFEPVNIEGGRVHVRVWQERGSYHGALRHGNRNAGCGVSDKDKPVFAMKLAILNKIAKKYVKKPMDKKKLTDMKKKMFDEQAL